ncbi:MAG TPA: HEAT repeat domain-containing protein, partial [Acidobacteriota bacterium]|nr:HEAT repeat domain-containing protein [Acidobacteriota bacterium]
MMKKCILLALIALITAPLLLHAAKQSTDELLAALKSEKASTREKAARELGERGEKLGLQALVAATADKDKNVQMAAVVAIGKINDPGQVSALCKAVRNANGEAQKEGLHLLTEHYIPNYDRDSLKEMWKSMADVFNPPHPAIAEPWIPVDDEAIDAILFVLDDKNSENRIEAAATLGILRTDKAIPRLTYYLNSPNPKMARTCVRALGYIGKSDSGSALVPMMKHSDREVVIDSIRVLGQFRYAPALPDLTQFLEFNRDERYKEVALQAISRIGDPSSEQTVKKYYSSSNKEMRQYSIEAFGRMKLRGYLDPLKRELQKEKDMRLKLAMCFSLFALGDPAYIESLVRALPDRIYKPQAREYIIELGKPAVPQVAGYLKSEKKELRLEVIRILADM